MGFKPKPVDEYPRLTIEDDSDRLSVVSTVVPGMCRIRIEQGVNKDGSVVGPAADMMLDADEMRQLFNWLGIQLHKH